MDLEGLLTLKTRVRVSARTLAALMICIHHFTSLGFSSFCIKWGGGAG